MYLSQAKEIYIFTLFFHMVPSDLHTFLVSSHQLPYSSVKEVRRQRLEPCGNACLQSIVVFKALGCKAISLDA